MKMHVSVLFFLFLTLTQLQAQWTKTNGPYGGNVKCLAVSGTNIFAGLDGGGGGIFRSTDNCANWVRVNKGLPFDPYIKALVVSGTNIFAGVNGGGVYRSTNNGEIWTPMNKGLPLGAAVWSLVVLNENIFAATIYSGGIYRSTDNGETWTPVNNGLDSATVYEGGATMAVSGNSILLGTQTKGIFRSTDYGANWKYCGYRDSTILSIAVSGSKIFIGVFPIFVFCSTDNGSSWTGVNFPGCNVLAFACSGTNIFAGTRTEGVYTSQDNGASWTPVNSGLPTNFGINSLVSFTNANGDTNLLCGNYRGVYLSKNNGLSWTEADNGLTGVTEHSVIASDTNLFIGTNCGIFLSTNSGATWTEANNGLTGLPCLNVPSLAISSDTKGSVLYAGVDGYPTGIYTSTDNGKYWTYCGVGASVTAIAVDNKDKGSNATIYAGTYGNGIFRSTDNGMSWDNINSGLTDLFISSLTILHTENGGTEIFAGTLYHVFRSTDNGTNWTKASLGLPAERMMISLIVLDKDLFVGIYGSGIYRSTTRGMAWTSVGASLPQNIWSLAPFGNNIFAGADGGVFLSANRGAGWKDISTGLPSNGNYKFNGVGYEESIGLTNAEIFVGGSAVGNAVWRRPLSEIFPSIWQTEINIKDNGNISQSLTFGRSPLASEGIDQSLGEAPLPPPAFGFFDARFHLPNGDDSWKDFRSADIDSVEWLIKFQPGGGGYPITFSWASEKLPEGSFYLKDVITGSIVNVNMKNSNLYTLTNSGINTFKIVFDNTKTLIEEKNLSSKMPNEYCLKQNYPNPFNPLTVIRYGLPKTSRVKIKIFNSIGKEVDILVNDVKNAGYHEMIWNASRNASGVYFCTIEAISEDGENSFKSASKLILMK